MIIYDMFLFSNTALSNGDGNTVLSHGDGGSVSFYYGSHKKWHDSQTAWERSTWWFQKLYRSSIFSSTNMAIWWARRSYILLTTYAVWWHRWARSIMPHHCSSQVFLTGRNISYKMGVLQNKEAHRILRSVWLFEWHWYIFWSNYTHMLFLEFYMKMLYNINFWCYSVNAGAQFLLNAFIALFIFHLNESV